jgi:hypothetical protein
MSSDLRHRTNVETTPGIAIAKATIIRGSQPVKPSIPHGFPTVTHSFEAVDGYAQTVSDKMKEISDIPTATMAT